MNILIFTNNNDAIEAIDETVQSDYILCKSDDEINLWIENLEEQDFFDLIIADYFLCEESSIDIGRIKQFLNPKQCIMFGEEKYEQEMFEIYKNGIIDNFFMITEKLLNFRKVIMNTINFIEESFQSYYNNPWLRAILDASPELLFVKDRKGKYIDVFVKETEENKIVIKEKSKLKGRYVEEVIDPELAEHFLAAIGRALDKNEVQSINYELDTDGVNRYYEAKVSPIEGKELVIWSARDETEKKNAIDKQNQLMKITSLSPNIVCILDEKLNVSFLNEKGKIFFNVFDNLEDFNILEYMCDPVHKNDFVDLIKHLKTDSFSSMETCMIDRGLNIKSFEVNAIYLDRLYGVDYYALIIHNISELKDINKKLEIAKEKAIEADRIKSIFLSNISHEVKTPINSIKGNTQLLMEEYSSGKIYEGLGTILGSVDKLIDVVNNIFEFAEYDKGMVKMDYSFFNIIDLVDRLTMYFKGFYTDNKNNLIFKISDDTPILAYGDSKKIEILLRKAIDINLKSTRNAIIELNISTEKIIENQHKYKFVIKNYGGNIDPLLTDCIEKMQADDVSFENYSLYHVEFSIIKRILELFEGASEYDINEKISKFEFNIVFQAKEDIYEKVITPHADTRGARLAFVDANQSVKRLISTMLQKLYFNVDEYESFEELLESLKDKAPYHDIYLIDMDEISNFHVESMKEIRELSVNKNARVLILTDNALIKPSDKEKYDCDHIIYKPINASILYDGITSVYDFNISSIEIVDKELNRSSKLLKDYKALVVDDNYFSRKVVGDLVERIGLQTEFKESGPSALEYLKDNKVDIVFADYYMPMMTGEELIENIKTNHEEIKCIIVSACSDDGEFSSTKADSVVSKPIDPSILIHELMKLLGIESSFKDIISPVQTRKNLSGVNIINFQDGLRTVSGNMDLYIKLLQGFKQRYKGSVNRIFDIIENKDYDQALIYLHDLKGMSGNIGAKDLYKTVVNLEKSIKSKEYNKLTTLFKEFESILDDVVDDVDVILGSQSKSEKEESKQEYSLEFMTEILLNLIDSLKLGKLKEVKQVIKEIDKYEKPSDIEFIFSELDDLIAKYRYTEAKNKAREIIKIINSH